MRAFVGLFPPSLPPQLRAWRRLLWACPHRLPSAPRGFAPELPSLFEPLILSLQAHSTLCLSHLVVSQLALLCQVLSPVSPGACTLSEFLTSALKPLCESRVPAEQRLLAPLCGPSVVGWPPACLRPPYLLHPLSET